VRLACDGTDGLEETSNSQRGQQQHDNPACARWIVAPVERVRPRRQCGNDANQQCHHHQEHFHKRFQKHSGCRFSATLVFDPSAFRRRTISTGRRIHPGTDSALLQHVNDPQHPSNRVDRKVSDVDRLEQVRAGFQLPSVRDEPSEPQSHEGEQMMAHERRTHVRRRADR
jgi:hypothetical protein